MRLLTTVLLLLAFICVALFQGLPLGDGYIEVEGTVCEWSNAPADSRSRLCWDGEIPNGAKLVPLENAAVTLFHCRDYAEQAIDETDIWREDARTAADGFFSAASGTNPSPFHAILRVEKQGYQRLQEMFLHSPKDSVTGFKHRATVLLVMER